MKNFFLGITIIFLNGCTIVENNYNPTRKDQTYTIDCSGGLNIWQTCQNKAKDICPFGYDNLGENGPHPDIVFFLNPGIGQSSSSPNLTRKMIVSCNKTGIFNEKSSVY